MQVTEIVTIANKSRTHTTKNLAIDFVTSCKQLCEKEGIDWESYVKLQTTKWMTM